MIRRLVSAITSALLGLLIFSTAVLAEEQDEVYLDPVTVTAEKKEEDVQKVAIPITVLGQTDIEDRNISKLSDIARTVPNLQFLSSGRPDGGSFNFRGLGMFGMSVLSEKSPVVIYYDGIPWDGRFGLDTDFGNIERIEFLRGPQGTLYGKNAMGGVLNIVTKDPGNETTGKITTSYESRNGVEARFEVQSPIIEDKLYYYLAGSVQNTDGYMVDHTDGGQHDWDKQDNKHLFMKGILKATDKITTSLQYSYDDSESGNAPFVVGRDLSYDITTGFTDPEFNSTAHNAALKVDYSAEAYNLASITTFKDMHTDSHQYFGFATNAGFDDIDKLNITEELRISSPGHGNQENFEWLMGAFLSYEDFKRNNTGYNFSGYVYNYPCTIDSKSGALFGEVSVPLFIDGLSASMGARYEYIEKSMDHRYENYIAATGAYVTPPSEYEISDNWGNLLGKFALEYQISPDYMLYASVAQGYSPGGFNYLETEKEYATFDEQRSIDYEFGLKAMLFSNKLMLNPNIFYSEYEDLQISQEVSSMKFIVVNAGKAHATGLELDFNAKPAKPVEIYGSLGITKAQYDEYEENSGYGTADYGGNTMTNTPVYTVNIGAIYRHDNGFFAMLDYQRLGKTYLSKDNSDHFKRDAFSLVNTKIGWEGKNGFEGYLYVRNLLDEKYFTEVSEEYDLFQVGEPRTIGVQLSYRF